MIRGQNRWRPLICELESALDPTAEGLPEEVFLFVSRVTPLINVDLLIRDESGRTLLTWRHDRFYGPGWHVPGGIIRHRESASARICAVAERELGASVAFDAQPILVQEGIAPVGGDRAHMISLLYRCRLTSALDPERRYLRGEPSPDQWQWHSTCPENLIQEQQCYAPFMA